MNFEQAREYSFLVKWKVAECFSGPECWCRMVLPVETIFYTHPDTPDKEYEYNIIDAGSIDQQTAEYIVKIHNEKVSIEQDIKKLKEEFNKLYSNPNCSITVTQNPSLNDYRIIKRKEID